MTSMTTFSSLSPEKSSTNSLLKSSDALCLISNSNSGTIPFAAATISGVLCDLDRTVVWLCNFHEIEK